MIGADPLAGFGPVDIIRGDALALPIPDASVDLIVTSPPYFALRSYQDGGQHYAGQLGSEATPDEFVTTLLAATREMVRVLKPSGSLWVNLGDKYSTGSGGDSNLTALGQRLGTAGFPPKTLLGIPWRYALRCIDELGLILRAELIWSKPNGLPESVTDRVRRSHEQWFHFVVSPRYFAAVDEIREEHAGEFLSSGVRNPRYRYADGQMPSKAAGVRAGKENRAGSMDGRAWSEANIPRNPLGKLPGSVREVPSAPLKVPASLGVDHFAAFPPAWPAWIIRGWSPAGICVACGEGRRPVVAKGAPIPTAQIAGDRKRRSGVAVGPMDRGDDSQWISGNVGAVNGQEWNAWKAANPDRITGYACGCPTPDAPTRPAVVLDPFGGTGTTAMAARALGRHGITVDLSADYCRLARWRCTDLDELAAVRGLPRAGRTVDVGQVSLFDALEASA